jgi:ribosome-associated protein
MALVERKSSREADDEFTTVDTARAREPEPAEEPSRTARKRASEELQRIGEQLLALSAQRLAALRLPERLHDAISEAKRLKSFGARRRQSQFIGKLMRGLDDEALDAVRVAVREARGRTHGRRG